MWMWNIQVFIFTYTYVYTYLHVYIWAQGPVAGTRVPTAGPCAHMYICLHICIYVPYILHIICIFVLMNTTKE